MLTTILACLALSAVLGIGAKPLANKAAALDRANFLPNGRPQTITAKHADGRIQIVSYDEDTMQELQAQGFNFVSVAEQTAIDLAADRAANAKPVLDAKAAKQVEQDEADTKAMMAELLAAYRAKKAAAAAPAASAAKS